MKKYWVMAVVCRKPSAKKPENSICDEDFYVNALDEDSAVEKVKEICSTSGWSFLGVINPPTLAVYVQ